MRTMHSLSAESVRQRRLMFGAYFSALYLLGLVPMILQLSAQGWSVGRFALLLLFIPLLGQIVYGFAVATAGYWMLRSGGDPLRVNALTPSNGNADKPLPATAIVMPVFNEDVSQVFQRLAVMYDSLQKTGNADNFDFFILSDSNNPNNWIAEENAWLELCKQKNAFGHIFYRKRKVSLHNKSGNIADFCRRWGASYRYMIVLDADSLMTGPTFVRLTQLMEQHPRAGIIQTNPKLTLGKTLFQRIMQFSTQLCGPMFSAGSNFWQLANGNFWGHNAIIRLHPFMKYCAIPELPASSPFGRRILSHDTIEAALMQKAGYHVWYAYDLDGGYEESPPNLAECMARDRRWCFGNMQHLYFLFSRDIRPLSRFHLLNGILAYGGSLLWLISLVISNIIALRDSNSHSVGFLNLGVGSFLLTYVIVMLFLPKVLGAAMIFGERRQGQLGGGTKVVLNVLAEMVFSVLMAPILMLFHAQFVVAALLGSKVSWGAQTRTGDDRLAWSSAIKLFGPRTVLMLAWLAIVLWFKPAFTGWMIFVFLGPLIAIPLSVFIGSTRIGTLARERGWFLVPEETQPPEEIRRMEEEDAPSISSPYFRRRQFAEDYGLLRVILDPYINAIHVSMLRQRQRASARTRSYINVLSQKILIQGPGSLNDREKRRLLWDADAITEIHRKLWGSPAAQLDQWWQDALRHYNDNSALDMRRRIQKV